MGQERGPLARLRARTIWGDDVDLEPRYASLYRLVIPLFDLVLIYTAIRAAGSPVPVFTLLTGGHVFPIVWGALLGVAAVTCLVGIAFPPLYRVEATGKVLVVALLAVYAVAMIIASGDSDNRGVVSGIALLGLPLAAWRLGDLATERGYRKARKAPKA